MDSFLPL